MNSNRPFLTKVLFSYQSTKLEFYLNNVPNQENRISEKYSKISNWFLIRDFDIFLTIYKNDNFYYVESVIKNRTLKTNIEY